MFNPAFEPLGVPATVYAERPRSIDTEVEKACARLIGPAARFFCTRGLGCEKFVKEVNARGSSLAKLNREALQAHINQLRQQLQTRKWSLDLVSQSFAVIREVAMQVLGIRHFDVQVMGGWILLNGMIAEMETGEGKTFTATLPAATVALAGLPVHVVTVNDYLAKRDAECLRPLYSALGLNVGLVTADMTAEGRREAYACDVTYCTNKELVFDYLRDRIALGRNCNRSHFNIAALAAPSSSRPKLILRGLHYAIIDEADSVMIDEARTPLIISQTGSDPRHAGEYGDALAAVAELELGSDFNISERERVVELTDSGRTRLVELLRPRLGATLTRWRREELARQALTALHLMQRNTHYLVKDRKVQIIDEYTGRAMPDRSWENGLHQLIELKEGADMTPENHTLSRITYQRFFRRYRRLAGMTGTAREVRDELWSVYRLFPVRVRPNRPVRRTRLRDSVYPTAEAKWQAVVARVIEIRKQRRPILIGTRSVAASEQLSSLLQAAGIPHQVLNAKQDAEEAEIIGRAGGIGEVTVATNMAGRGTDIRLGAGVAELGGLHVIGTERHEARRIDRQLWGRCGRQGDPGSYEMIVSVEDEIVATHGIFPKKIIGMVRACSRRFAPQLDSLVLLGAQYSAERFHSRLRHDLLKMDEQLEATLAFSGSFE